MKKLTLNFVIFVIVLILSAPFSESFSQDSELQIKLFVDTDELNVSNGSEFTATSLNKVTLNFEFTGSHPKPDAVYYKVFVDAVNLNLKDPFGTSLVLPVLKPGKHIIKIVASDETGWESSPFFLQVVIKESSIATENEPEKEKESGLFSLTNILVFLIAAQFIVIVLLLFIRKKTVPSSPSSGGTNSSSVSNKPDIQPSESEKVSKLKKTNDSLNKQNKFYQRQINELKQYISNLEKSNLELIENKEKISNSKTQLQVLQERKDELFATAIHDIKNPAAALRGYIELLESYDLTVTEQQEILQSLTKISNKILDLTQEISTTIAQQSVEIPLNIEDVNIQKLIDSVRNRNLVAAKKKDINIISTIPPDFPLIKADPGKIDEVFDNLISNAIKFSYPNSSVSISAFFESEQISVEVSDTGVGLDSEDMKGLFKKGAKLHAKPTAGEHSSGLGLWIVKNLVEAHNGKVSAKSTQGKGSVFTVQIPRNL